MEIKVKSLFSRSDFSDEQNSLCRIALGILIYLFLWSCYQFQLHDSLRLHSKSELLTGSERPDPLIKAFCGLFGAETSHSSDVAETSISDNRCDSNQNVIDSQPSLPNSFVLPPFCRKDHHSTYGSDYPQRELSLALWFESVFCREVEEESIEGTSLLSLPGSAIENLA